MRVASIRPDDVAIVEDDCFILVGETLAAEGLLANRVSMMEFITQYDSIRDSVRTLISKGRRIRLDKSLLKPPVERPSKIWAAAFNYKRGTNDIKDGSGRGETLKFTPEQALEMTFLKPSSAVIGPEQAILIPRGERIVYPELELCVVIGKEARDVGKENALDYVFGYTIM